MSRPFVQTAIEPGRFTRCFSATVPSEELVWHRDHANRTVIVKEGQGWLLQLDNQLPVVLEANCEYFIPANTYHRVKRGSSDLIIEIVENQ